MASTLLNSLQGKALIAMPTLTDEYFERSVCFICFHNEEGAVGLVTTQALEMTEKDLLIDQKFEVNENNDFDRPVFRGGPMHTDRGFILHRAGSDWRSTNHVIDDIFVTTSQDILEAIAKGEITDNYLISLGYAAWDAGQLEQEIADNSWLITDVDAALLFNTPYHRRWTVAMHQLGIHNLAQLCCSQEGHA